MSCKAGLAQFIPAPCQVSPTVKGVSRLMLGGREALGVQSIALRRGGSARLI